MRNGPGPVPSKTTERFSLRYFPCTQTKWRDQAGCTNTKGRTGTPLAYDSHATQRCRSSGLVLPPAQANQQMLRS